MRAGAIVAFETKMLQERQLAAEAGPIKPPKRIMPVFMLNPPDFDIPGAKACLVPLSVPI